MIINMLRVASATLVLGFFLLISSCAIWIDGTPQDDEDQDSLSVIIDTGNNNGGGGTTRHIASSSVFPYENTGNWWWYTAGNGNRLFISVQATITDGPDTYYKVVFAEQNIDTTEDWFRNTSAGIEFNSSLQGEYSVFLPSSFGTTSGTFSCGGSTVSYSYQSSMNIGNKSVNDVIECRYSWSVLHGFDKIAFADSLGIVSLIDEGGRFDVQYLIDSCSVNGVVKLFM
jgi:hypothetical protein